MFIDGGLADTKTAGNLPEGDSFTEVLHDDVAADGRFQPADTLLQGFQFFFEPFRRSDACVKIQQVEVFHAFLYLTVANHVQASVSYACKQIGFSCFFPKVARTVEQLGEDVVHYILALRIIVQKYGGLPIHLTVMLFEQLFQFLFVCHTLLIHMKTGLLNPKQQLFSAKLQNAIRKKTTLFQ